LVFTGDCLPVGGRVATVRNEPTGKVTVLTGLHPTDRDKKPHSHKLQPTSWGVDLNDVTVIHGDTGVASTASALLAAALRQSAARLS